jgi:hypothetical protein
LLAEVSQIARARIRWTVVVIAEITTGDHPKRTDGCERSRFGPTQCVVAIAMADDLPLQTAWQVEVAREHSARIDLPLARIPVPLVPARAVSRVFAALVAVRLPRIVPWISIKLARVVVAIARTSVGLLPVVIAIVV